jgi:hypothetical protein
MLSPKFILMANNSETGHAVNVDHFLSLKTITLGFGTSYEPANPAIKQAALETKHSESKLAHEAVTAPLAAWKGKVTARQLVMKPLSKLSTRIIRALKASGAAQETIDQANEFIRKIKGSRAKATVDNGQGSSVSASQLSAAQRISNFRNLVGLLETVPAYAPSAVDLQLPSLQALCLEMETANGEVITAEAPLTAARQRRDVVLYAEGTGLTDIAKLVKDEVAAIFGFGSPEHKQVRRLQFTGPR